ncbi:hypothetical protein C2869_18415 [Saccharobesus litoralis]|uniref:Plasmid transfer operon, TraF, protein n=1 Tax=Saccharobesus litoralis TaxID=2172099 RepID=A0A2S0VVP5_9ALTE|nr:conjugal transfer protein TraF [Saccharobesus litoralis]AWB68265.1 hypothetical protein C2869_18415 [Saccharobesus litoralis]
MRLLKTSLALAILAASATSFATESFNAKSLAMSGSGLAVSDFSYGTALNPALGSNYDASDDFNLNLNIGAIGSDPDELVDQADAIVDLIDRLDGQTIDTQQEIDLIKQLDQQLTDMSGDTMFVDAGLSVEFAIPNKYVATNLFIRGNAALTLTPEYESLDSEAIDRIVQNNGQFSEDDLDSRMIATGAAIAEIGLNFATKFKVGTQVISVGIAPKYQTVETIIYNESINNFDEDDFDADQYTAEDSNFNLDLGIQTAYKRWNFGAVLKNAIESEYEVVGDKPVTIEPQLSLGVGYKNSWAQLSLDVDATAAQDFSSRQDVQFARFGLELDAFNFLQIRGGYRHDLEGTYDDTVSVGLGLSPFDVFNIDLAVVAGDNDTLGGAVQIGFGF